MHGCDQSAFSSSRRVITHTELDAFASCEQLTLRGGYYFMGKRRSIMHVATVGRSLPIGWSGRASSRPVPTPLSARFPLSTPRTPPPRIKSRFPWRPLFVPTLLSRNGVHTRGLYYPLSIEEHIRGNEPARLRLRRRRRRRIGLWREAGQSPPPFHNSRAKRCARLGLRARERIERCVF